MNIFNQNLADSPRGFAAQRDAAAGSNITVMNPNILTDTIYPQTVCVPAGFYTNTVVVTGNTAVFDLHMAAGVYVDTVCAGACVVVDI